MPKIEYKHKNFRAAALEVIRLVNEIIDEYRDEGLDLSLRQIYYQFVARGYVENSTKEYSRLGDIIGDGRMAGLIDWSIIKDRSRRILKNSHWSDPGEILRTARLSFKVDHWEGQQFVPEVWIEKEALIGVVASVCEGLDVAHYACKGYVSLSGMWEASERFEDLMDNGHTPIIIHLGDHDPSGIDMTRDIEDRITTFTSASGRHLRVERIALNMDQVEEYNPPPNVAKFTDSRFGTYVSEYGNSSWELDALDPTVLRDLITDKVLQYRDDEIFHDVLERETEYRRILLDIEENWEQR